MRRILKIGHRGAAGHAPENTLAAIRKGIALGVDFVEIDVRCTADGVLVVLHDATVNRTTNGKGPIERLSLRDVRALDAGNGEYIPTLEEVLGVLAGQTGLMVELKIKGVAKKTVEVVQAAQFNKPVIYASFLHEELGIIRSIDAQASVMLLFGRLPRAPVVHAMKYSPSHVGLRHDTISRRLVKAFHDEDMLVCVYTADRIRDIERAWSAGVDGIISNVPERVDSHQIHV
ncbi:MAG TPA: glycerophosphodiester phosphodiesterase family protein [Nitrospira sp.]|nr:glycerophosphodiester phosphodiesterase family protein [Nitrospira sp.]